MRLSTLRDIILLKYYYRAECNLCIISFILHLYVRMWLSIISFQCRVYIFVGDFVTTIVRYGIWLNREKIFSCYLFYRALKYQIMIVCNSFPPENRTALGRFRVFQLEYNYSSWTLFSIICFTEYLESVRHCRGHCLNPPALKHGELNTTNGTNYRTKQFGGCTIPVPVSTLRGLP